MILFIGHDASRTGAPKSLLLIASHLVKEKGVKAAFILREGGPLLPKYAELGEVFIWNDIWAHRKWPYRLVNKMLAVDKKRQKQFLNKLKRKDCSLIFNNTVVNGEILKSAKPYLNVPVISRIPELEYAVRVFDRRGLSTLTLSHSDHIIAVSQAVKKNLIVNHQIAPEKITVVYGAVHSAPANISTNAIKVQYNIPSNTVVVGACGSMIWRKGIDLFIQVARKVLKQEKDVPVYFLWVGGQKGSGPFIQYERELELLGLTKRVLLTGEVSNVHDYYAAMDIFLLTSREDPFPLVNLEAATHSLPIICFRDSGGSEEFVDDSNGAVVEFADVDAMVNSTFGLLRNEEIRIRKGAVSKKKTEHYSYSRMTDGIWAVVQKHFKS